MSATTREERRELRLQAYHDGELGAFGRWRVEAELRRSPELRAALAALGQIGEAARAQESEVRSPGLWETLSLELASEDRRDAVAPKPSTAGRRGLAGWAWGSLGAAAVAAGAAWLWLAMPSAVLAPTVLAPGAVRSLDTHGTSFVVEERPGTTIIWLMGETTETI